jgi:hypothetical protein
MPPADNPPKRPSSEREAKLAQALRANLRRRKAGGGPKGPDPDGAKSGEKP